jgi:demethoxyubiquinone hydroxylase (CLK1/Coq7/Cat5 family)
MDASVLTAAISAGAAVLTAIAALVANHRAFGILDSRINDIGRRFDDQNKRFDIMAQDLREVRADLRDMRTDLKEFFKIQADFDKRLSRIEDKLGIPPH